MPMIQLEPPAYGAYKHTKHTYMYNPGDSGHKPFSYVNVSTKDQPFEPLVKTIGHTLVVDRPPAAAFVK